MNIIDGKQIANIILEEIAIDTKETGVHPSLAIILIGNNPSSHTYVNIKEKEGKAVGIDVHKYLLEESVQTAEVLETIRFLNNDAGIDSIIVQLPLPEHLDTESILNEIDPEKDVDCLNEINLEKYTTGFGSIQPPLTQAVLTALEATGKNLSNKTALVIAKNEKAFPQMIFALNSVGIASLPFLFTNLEDFQEAKSYDYDIIVSLVGKEMYLNSEHIKEGAIIIDIGFNKTEDGKTCGDVDFDSVSEKASWITPVPGGIGPLTVAMLLKNAHDIPFQK